MGWTWARSDRQRSSGGVMRWSDWCCRLWVCLWILNTRVCLSHLADEAGVAVRVHGGSRSSRPRWLDTARRTHSATDRPAAEPYTSHLVLRRLLEWWHNATVSHTYLLICFKNTNTLKNTYTNSTKYFVLCARNARMVLIFRTSMCIHV